MCRELMGFAEPFFGTLLRHREDQQGNRDGRTARGQWVHVTGTTVICYRHAPRFDMIRSYLINKNIRPYNTSEVCDNMLQIHAIEVNLLVVAYVDMFPLH